MLRSEATKIEKGQKPKEILKETESPTGADMANWNNFTMRVDETNNKLYIKGKTKNFTVALTEV